MINTSRNHLRVRRAIDALQPVADEHQHFINCLPTSDRLPLGQLLSISRTTDTLERILSELHALLDHPPGVGGEGPPRSLPRPVWPVDGIAEPGVAVPAAGDGSPAAP